ncbi:carbon-nitrogen hydrolase [Fusarium acutatum]|uniref:Carbon-nitrogen hydrolase n=1 Tax=Fusarium acutatum TaxID=78861 RepID=A0A8H4K074_9HYPO|nr:carbon-nitrogen hydrolase [Fusarium acutatum]
MAVTIPSPSFKVALVQMKPKPLDAEHNFEHAAEQIRIAADQGAALAVLPEYHLTGWVPEEPSFALSPEDAGKYRKKYQDLAADLHINICAGTFVSHAPNPDDQQNADARPTLLNTSDFIDHNGNLLGTYTKTNLWIPERHTLTSFVDHAKNISKDDYAAPNPHQVIDTPLGRVGILVCWDLAFPEAFRQLVLAGAKIIIIPSYWTALDMCKDGLAYNADCERMFIQSALVTRAFENTAAVIYCNAGGPAAEGFFGCSQVALPIVGTVAGSFTDGEEAMRILDVDMKTVDIAERNYQIRQDLARDDWHYGYLKNTVARL